MHQLLESQSTLPQVVQIEGFKYKAVKNLLEWICGYHTLLDNCYTIEVLSDMLLFADFYDIQRPVDSVTQQIEAVPIEESNLITAMECVTKLERVESGKDLANKLEKNCAKFFEEHYRSAKAVGLFVNINIYNINLVNRLLIKSANLNTAVSKCSLYFSRLPCSKCTTGIFIGHCKKIAIDLSETKVICEICYNIEK